MSDDPTMAYLRRLRGEERMAYDGPCPNLFCLAEGPHEHTVCPACRAVRHGNLSCPTCRAYVASGEPR